MWRFVRFRIPEQTWGALLLAKSEGYLKPARGTAGFRMSRVATDCRT
jgi:hypothetical protein